MAEFVMPSLGPDMEAGTLVEWKVKPGDVVKKGDIVAIVDTEKASIEIEVFMSGVVEQILVPLGVKVPVGTPLARIAEAGAAPGSQPVSPPPPHAAGPASPAPAPAPPVAEQPAPAAAAASAEPSRVRVSPAARKLAAERGIDLARIKGSGPGGAIDLADVEAALAAAPAPAAPYPEAAKPAGADLSAMRRAIAAAMSRSKREIPHYYLSQPINFAAAQAWLARHNAEHAITERLLPATLLLKAVALGIREVPEMNGFCVEGQYRSSEAIHVGMAIALRRGGLVAPAIHETDKKPLIEIMRDLQDVVTRVRAGRLRSSEMSDPTITVTSLGDRGVDAVFGVIYPPQVAIVGFGTPRETPWAKDGLLGVAPVMTASLSADHRVSDGHRGALFLLAIDRLLQEPEKLA